MSWHEWDSLTRVEYAFMINSCEVDILPGVRGDLDGADETLPVGELAQVLLALVERGWVEVRRVVPWTSPSGENGFQPGELIPPDQLSVVLDDADNWKYRDDGEWIGSLTLVQTEAGRKITHRSPEEMADEVQRNR